MAEKISKEDFSIILNEIKMAEALNEQELEPIVIEAVQRYTGKHVPTIASAWTIVLNEIYPIIQFNLPSIFLRNPRVFLKPKTKYSIVKRRNPETLAMEDVQMDNVKSARTQEAILNYTLGEIGYKEAIRRVLMDSLLFTHGILWHGYKGEFGMTEEDSIFIKDENVFVQRISPMRFLKDPSVSFSDLHEGRWVSRSFDVRLQDIIEDEELDVDKKQIKGHKGYGQKIGTKDVTNEMKMNGGDVYKASSKSQSLIDTTDKEFQSSMGSRFLKVYEVFIKPTKAERRKNIMGKVLLMTPEQNRPLRISKWVYKAEGFPAQLLQFNYVPDQMLGIPDIDTYSQIADHKNLVINQQIRNAENLNKTIFAIAGDSTTEEEISKIRDGKNNIITMDGESVNGKLAVVSGAGGASSELYMLDGRIDKNLQDKSGVSDLKRGFLQSGEESATSVQLRNAGSSARPAYRQDIMADFLRNSAKYLNQLLKQFMPVKDAVRITGTLDVQWSDEFTKEEIQAETDVDLDVISMLPEDPTREIQSYMQLLQLAVDGLSNPAVQNKLGKEGSTFNLTPLLNQILHRMKIMDPEIFRQIRPEESDGFASIAELRSAKENISAAMSGEPLPSPPAAGQDHRTRLEIYAGIATLLVQLQQESQVLNELILLQQQIMQEEEDKQQPRTPRAGVRPAGKKNVNANSNVGI